MQPINVLLIEDDPVWLGIIGDHLNDHPHIQVVAKADNKEQAVQLATTGEYDVIVTDMMLSPTNLDGIDIATEVLKIRPAKIIVLTSLSRDEVIVESFAAGALNFINKRNYKDVAEAVISMHENRFTIHTDAVQTLMRDYQQLKQKEYDSMLTNTEKEILRFVHGGDSQQEIADKMFTALGTIKKHVSNILKKLNVKSSKDAADVAKKRNII
jgi:two-component system response regulator DevR